MSSQIPLPFETAGKFAREDFIVGPGNSAAVGFVDSYPSWPSPVAALYGPAGSGKSHLAGVWAARAGATIMDVAVLDEDSLLHIGASTALAIENVDAAPLASAAETTLFALIERGQKILFTGREAPPAWPALLPDLASRFRALLAFPSMGARRCAARSFGAKTFFRPPIGCARRCGGTDDPRSGAFACRHPRFRSPRRHCRFGRETARNPWANKGIVGE